MGKVNMIMITMMIIFLTVISAFIDLNVGKINFIIDIIRNIIVVIIEFFFFSVTDFGCHLLKMSTMFLVIFIHFFLSLHCCWYFCCDDRHRAMNSTVITCSINLINDRAKVLFEMGYCFFSEVMQRLFWFYTFFSFILFFHSLIFGVSMKLFDMRITYNFQLSASKAERIVITVISRKPNLCLPWLIIWRKTNLGQMISRDGRARGDVSSPQRTLL